MKRILFYAFSILLMSACTETLNDRAEALIEEDMQGTLVNPDSYDAIKTVTDSAFAPQDNPEMFSLIMDIARENVTISSIEQSIADLKANMKNAETGMNLASLKKDGSYRENYDRFKKYYDECKKQIDQIEPEMDAVSERIEDKVEALNKISNGKHVFIGYKAVHCYKADNQNGEELTDSCYYLFDKDMKKVVMSLPLDKYRIILETVNAMTDKESKALTDSVNK